MDKIKWFSQMHAFEAANIDVLKNPFNPIWKNPFCLQPMHICSNVYEIKNRKSKKIIIQWYKNTRKASYILKHSLGS